MNCVLAGSIVPISFLRNGAPLFFCTFVVYTCQAAAIIERIITYRSYAVGDCYTCQAAATKERILAYRSYTIGDCYTRKSTATTERIIAYRRDTIGDCYTRKSTAFKERRLAYRRDAAVSRYHTVFATQNQCFACGFNNTIPLAVVFSITYSNFDVCQIVATSERIITYRRDAVGNGYACQAAATRERRRAYRRDATTDCYACQAATIVERIVRDFFYVIAEC